MVNATVQFLPAQLHGTTNQHHRVVNLAELSIAPSYKLSANVKFVLRDDLMYKVNNTRDNPYALFIPKQLVPLFLKNYHDENGPLELQLCLSEYFLLFVFTLN